MPDQSLTRRQRRIYERDKRKWRHQGRHIGHHNTDGRINTGWVNLVERGGKGRHVATLVREYMRGRHDW